MISLGFDARMIAHSGIGTYIREILKIVTSNPEFDLTLFGDLKLISDYYAQKVLLDSPIYSLREQWTFPILLNQHHVNFLHVPHYNIPLAYSGRLVVTVHDLIHLKYPTSKLAYFYARSLIHAACHKAQIIIADSIHTQNDLLEWVGVNPKKIKVVYPGLGNLFSDAPVRTKPNLESNVLLYVGNIRPTKNIPVLVNAFLKAEKKLKNIQLILAGKNSMTEWTQQFANHPSIQFMGEVQLRVLKELYQKARLFVFPSLYEGFGLPPLEAMSCGVPVLSSNAASLPEVLGHAALQFDPNNENELAEKICYLWENAHEQESLIQKGYQNIQRFSWNETAQQVTKIYQSIA